MNNEHKIYDYNILNITGHEKPVEFLKNLFHGGRMPSGLLFHGRQNIGKRFVAAAFAASVLCGDYALYERRRGEAFPSSDDPVDAVGGGLNFCGKCPSCIGVLNGTSQNLMLVEPSGSSIKIDNIHKIGSFLSLTPYYQGYRFIIIDEAAAMTSGAANALLKMLEEPSAKTVFILIVHNLSILLPTVISRCLLLGFGPVSDKVLTDAFRSKFPDMEEDILRLYSKIAMGSYSDFYSLIKGDYLEKRNLLIDTLFKELAYNRSNVNPYDMSNNFLSGAGKGGEKEKKAANFEMILFILRDVYIYYVTKSVKLLYNEDIAGEIKGIAEGFEKFGITKKDLIYMINLTVSHMEKMKSYNLNKTIALDSYFSGLLYLKGRG